MKPAGEGIKLVMKASDMPVLPRLPGLRQSIFISLALSKPWMQYDFG
ncbi:MAG: hypothetical protein WBL40_07385 [Terrimicrobiaceae bacterium]